MSNGFNGRSGFNGRLGFIGRLGFNGRSGTGGGGFPNPVNALYNYLFKDRQDIIDNVSGVVSAQLTRDSVKNVGSPLVQYPANVAAFVPNGVDLEGEATQILPNSEWIGGISGEVGVDAAAPTGWGFVSGGGFIEYIVDAGGLFTWVKTVANNTRPALTYTFSVSANTTYYVRAELRNVSGTIRPNTNFTISAGSLPAGAVLSYPVCTANPSGVSNGVLEDGEMILQLDIAGTAGNAQLRVGMGANSALQVGEFEMSQIWTATDLSSWISTGSANTVREADFLTIPASDAYYDSPLTSTVPCALGDNDGSGYTNGVNYSARRFNYAGTVTGKYVGGIVAANIGDVYIGDNGVRVTIDTIVNVNIPQWQSTSLYNPTGLSDEDAVRQAFEYPKSFTIDSSRGTNDLATQKALRASAGDVIVWKDITSTDQVTIPSLSLDAATANQVLLQSGDTGVFYDGANLVADINGTTDSMATSFDAITNAGYIYEGGSIKVILNGVKGAGTASAAPALGNYFSIGSNIANINPANGVYGQVLVETP